MRPCGQHAGRKPRCQTTPPRAAISPPAVVESRERDVSAPEPLGWPRANGWERGAGREDWSRAPLSDPDFYREQIGPEDPRETPERA
jgi:hypothetical protein